MSLKLLWLVYTDHTTPGQEIEKKKKSVIIR